jgi:hypothetical protein
MYGARQLDILYCSQYDSFSISRKWLSQISGIFHPCGFYINAENDYHKKKRPRITWRLHRTVSKNKTKKVAQYYHVLEGHECSSRGCSAVLLQGDSVLFLWTVCVCDLDLGRWLFVSFPEANIQRVRQMGRCSSDVTRSYPAGCNVEIHRVADQIVSGRWRSFGLAKVIPMVSVPLWKVPVALPRWRFCGCPAMIDLGQRMNPCLSKFIILDSTNTPGYHTFLAILSAWTWQ